MTLLTMPPVVRDLLTAVETEMKPVDEYDLSSRLQLVAPLEVLTDEEKRGARAEMTAFLYVAANNDRAPWGKYFGVMSSGTRADGTEWFIPDARYLDGGYIDHWKARADETTHPTLKARYADLAWEFADFVEGGTRNAKFCRVAAEAYCSIVEKGLENTEHQAWPALARAIELSLAVSDPTLTQRALDLMIEYFDASVSRGERFMWWHLPMAVREHKPLRRDDKLVAAVVDRLEGVLSRHSDINNQKWFDHFQSKDAAQHLSYFYERAKQRDKKTAALAAAAQAFGYVAGKADGILASMLLPQAHALYCEAGLSDEAASIERKIFENKDRAVGEMKSYSVSLPISEQELEESITGLIGANTHETLRNVAAQFLIRKESTEKLVKSVAEKAVLMSLFSVEIMGPDGFSVARVGSVEDDLDGRALQQAAQSMSMLSGILALTLHRIRSDSSFTPKVVLSFLTRSRIFSGRDLSLIEEGIVAWFADDAIKAIHVLTFQVEAVLRDMLRMMGGSTHQPNKLGGFDVRGLGQVLASPQMKLQLEPNIRFHLRALYCAPQGWNLRNNIAHGLPQGRLNMPVANWCIHSLLLLALLAKIEEEAQESPSP